MNKIHCVEKKITYTACSSNSWPILWDMFLRTPMVPDTSSNCSSCFSLMNWNRKTNPSGQHKQNIEIKKKCEHYRLSMYFKNEVAFNGMFCVFINSITMLSRYANKSKDTKNVVTPHVSFQGLLFLGLHIKEGFVSKYFQCLV